jgi:hypothetical protein
MAAAPGPRFSFRTDLFPIERGEDVATNPSCFGRALAEWLRARFRGLGYEVEDVIAEDWGFCVMLQRRPFMLWIGCRNEFDGRGANPESGGEPPPQPVAWHCAVVAEAPVWTRFFWSQLLGDADVGPPLERAADHLDALLCAEPRLRDIRREEPELRRA